VRSWKMKSFYVISGSKFVSIDVSVICDTDTLKCIGDTDTAEQMYHDT